MTKEFIKQYLDNKHPILFGLKSSTGMNIDEACELSQAYNSELQAKVEGLEREVDRLKGLLYNITTAGSIDQHTKDYTWQQFKTDNQL